MRLLGKPRLTKGGDLWWCVMRSTIAVTTGSGHTPLSAYLDARLLQAEADRQPGYLMKSKPGKIRKVRA